MKHYLLLMLLMAVSNTYIWSQNVISGQVFDELDQPVPGAEIYIEELHTGTTSDTNGAFQLTKVPKGIHQLTVSFFGYNTVHLTIDMAEDNSGIQINLQPSVFEMDEVILSAPFNKLQNENVMKIESRSIESLRKKGAPTLMQSISSIPGVAEISTGIGIGKPVIRGLSANRVLVYTQGVRLENQQFGSEHGLGMNDSGVESIEVIKGPASLLYGSDALGGVLYINPEKFAFQGETDINLNQNFYSNTLGTNTSLGVKTSTDQFKFLVRGGLNSHADYQIPNGDRVTNTRFNEKDIKAGVGLNFDQIVSEIRYNFTQSEIGIPEGDYGTSKNRTTLEPYQELNNHILSLHNHFYLNKSKIDLNLGYIKNQRKEFEEHGHEETEDEHGHDEPEDAHEEAALNMDLTTFSYDLKYNFQKLGRFETIAGVQGMYQTNKNSGEEILIPDATTNDLGVLITSIFTINDKHSLQGGLRYDIRKLSTKPYEIHDDHHHEEEHDEDEHDEDQHEDEAIEIEGIDRNFNNITFSVGYKASLFDLLTTRINLASGFRAPNLAELTSFGVHHGTNRFEIGNPELKSENNFQVDLSLEYGNKHFEVFANGFYNQLNDYIFAHPTGESIEDHQVYRYVQNDANLYGGEFGLHLHPHPFDWLHIESNFETVIGKQGNGNYLPLIPANKWSNTLRFEWNSYRKLSDLYASLGLDAYFEQNRVSEFESKTPGYQLLNMRVGGELNFGKFDLGINFSLNNLLDQNYISHLSVLKADMIPNPGRNVVLGVRLQL